MATPPILPHRETVSNTAGGVLPQGSSVRKAELQFVPELFRNKYNIKNGSYFSKIPMDKKIFSELTYFVPPHVMERSPLKVLNIQSDLKITAKEFIPSPK